jgi:hypothetical protein
MKIRILFNEVLRQFIKKTFPFWQRLGIITPPNSFIKYQMLEWGERFLPWVEGGKIHYEHL